MTGIFWVLSLFWLGPILRATFGFHGIGRATLWFLIFPITNLIWQAGFASGAEILPGWGQRVAFFGYFLWVAWVGRALGSKWWSLSE